MCIRDRCREGENACVYKTNGGVLETIITNIDIHTKERKSNGCGYKTEHVGLGLRGVSKEQLEKGDRVIVKNANMYGVIRQIKRCRFHQIKTGLSEHLTMG